MQQLVVFLGYRRIATFKRYFTINLRIFCTVLNRFTYSASIGSFGIVSMWLSQRWLATSFALGRCSGSLFNISLSKFIALELTL